MKKNVKKLLCTSMAMLMTVSVFAGCGGSEKKTETSDAAAGTATEGSDGKIKVSIGISADNQPYSYMDENEEYAGYEYELLMTSNFYSERIQ